MIIGIDIGVTGGIAVLSATGELIEVHAMPCLADGPAGRRAVNGPLLASIVISSYATRAFVEHVSARPGEGAVGAFAFGRSRGVVEGVLAAAGVRCQFLTPACWKRAVGLPPGRDKDASRAAAIQRWPARAELFYRKKDDGVAEAALIATAGTGAGARAMNARQNCRNRRQCESFEFRHGGSISRFAPDLTRTAESPKSFCHRTSRDRRSRPCPRCGRDGFDRVAIWRSH